MKKHSLNVLITSLRGGLFLFLFFSTWIPLGTRWVWASPELDRQYSFETIGILKSWDSMEGLFSDSVAAVYQEYFSKQARFVVNNLTSADALFHRSKLPYKKVIEDSEILKQLARSTRTQSFLRTRITKEGLQYTVTLDWLHAPQMELVGSIRFTIEDPRNGIALDSKFLAQPFSENLDRLFALVPFIAHVTGRDNQAVTVNLGRNSTVKAGDVLTLATLEEVKRHPLLNEIVDWKWVLIGRVQVEQVEEGMVFCKLLDEESGRAVSRFQKVLQVQSPQQKLNIKSDMSPVSQDQPETSQKPSQDMPKLGSVRISLPAGSYSWQLGSNSATNTGGGFLLGGRLDGQIWLTKQWFADLGFGSSLFGFSQKDISTGNNSTATQSGGVSGSLFTFKFNFGYSHHLSNSMIGPKVWAKLGYKSNSTSLPTSNAELTGPVSFNAIFIGAGGMLPIRGQWDVVANLNLRLLSFVKAAWLAEFVTSASDVEMVLGGAYRLDPRMTLMASIELGASNIGFSGGSSINQKTVTFVPSFLYYF